MKAVVREHRTRICLTYILFVLENVIRMSEPFFLGLAVDGLISGSGHGLLIYVVPCVSRILIGAFRHLYDTRTFSGIYAELAVSLVQRQRMARVSVTRIVARTAMSREFIDFFERDVPIIVYGLFNVVGSILMIGHYDITSMLLCLGLCLPICVISRVHAVATGALNHQLNDEYEQQVDTITDGTANELDAHFQTQRRLQVCISDREAASFTLNHALLLVVTALCLFSACRVSRDAGNLLAMVQYLTLLSASFTQLPFLVQQITCLKDIVARIEVSGAKDKTDE